ncbi:uncharacterized protein [Spinacia oleracea]|uniref:Retrotransposon gag domain-containing protein n=1 Tax=Spinacia oleracea TaxID=3562 RepID=A0ABM3RHK7_SPIOL|nr:uncharacterized protein LOC130469692 [Spinacia oleracea]
MFFPFSLSGKAKLWINGLNREAMKITDWESLALAFYVKYFSTEKTARLRSQIIAITQLVDESLFEAWERFKFYNGLGDESRLILDSAASGRFMQLHVSRAMEDVKIDALAAHNKIIDNQLAQMATSLAKRTQGQLPSLSENRETANAITLRSGHGYEGPSMSVDVDSRVSTSGPMEKVVKKVVCEKEATPEVKKGTSIQVPPIALPFPNWQLKSKLAKQFGKFLDVVKNLQFYNGLGDESRLILDSAASGRFMQLHVSRAMEDVKIDALAAHNKIIDNQLAQMATSLAKRTQGQLPSLPENRETANAITLRSGHGYEGPSMSVDVDSRVSTSGPMEKVVKKVVCEKEATPEVKKGTSIQVPPIALPFPNWQLKRGDKVTFNLNSALKSLMLEEEQCCRIDVVDFIRRDNVSQVIERDPLEAVFCCESSAGDSSSWSVE